ncbi:hypothetical protein ABZ865_19550 [Streptomyces sp. NPDC047085]|uniref:hypothetical protein n=1 Tax=Streptomyces sp. NPDC047085 TaxID=3155140 RepID=UPI0033CACCE4
MQHRGRTLRFTAVLMFVVLALTGFSSGRSRGHHKSSHSSGGGCSSSHQDHDDSDDNAYDDSNGDTGNGSSGYLEDATVELVSCATRKKPYATVEVTNPNDTGATFSVTVYYKDRRSKFIDYEDVDVTVPANGTQTAKIPFNKAYLARLDHCEPQPNATVVS